MTLLGAPSGELRVPADAFLEVVDALLEGARQATRFVVDGESARKGTRPAWLDAACSIFVTGLHPGSVVVALEAPSLAETAPERFGAGQQASLFTDARRLIDSHSSSIDVFGGVLASVLRGDREHVLADRALLATCARLARSARGAFSSIRFDGIAGLADPVIVQRDDAAKIELLRDETPEPRPVRVTGTLDTISASKSEVVLTLADGSPVTARLGSRDNSQLRDLFGSRVVVSGVAQFRPSGKLLAIDVEYLGAAREGDSLFDAVPRAMPRQLAVLQPQDELSGVASFFGTWPGDETDEDLLQALQAIR